MYLYQNSNPKATKHLNAWYMELGIHHAVTICSSASGLNVYQISALKTHLSCIYMISHILRTRFSIALILFGSLVTTDIVLGVNAFRVPILKKNFCLGLIPFVTSILINSRSFSHYLVCLTIFAVCRA